jgi:hypothetical protein
MRGSFIVLAFLLFAGCGFRAVTAPRDFAGDDFSTVIPDLAGVDLTAPPGSDLALPPGSDLSLRADMAPSQPVCALPNLMITVENLASVPGGGSVARLNLGDGSALPTPCATLKAGGLMTQQPQSSAYTNSRVAVMGIDELQVIDPQNDTIIFEKPLQVSDDFPIEVFPLSDPSGNQLFAAAWGNTTSTTDIARVDAWNLTGGLVQSWELGSMLNLGLGIIDMTALPMMPVQFLACDVDADVMGKTVDPWSNTIGSLVTSGIAQPHSIYADVEGTQTRIAWVDSTSPTSVFYYNSAEGTGLFGPIHCAGCTLIHAVPDPTDNLRFFGLCDGPTVDSRHVVRFSSSGGSCDTVLEGALFPQERLSRLSIAE